MKKDSGKKTPKPESGKNAKGIANMPLRHQMAMGRNAMAAQRSLVRGSPRGR